MEPVRHNDDPPPPKAPSAERRPNAFVAGLTSVALTLLVGVVLVAIVVAIAGLVLSATDRSSLGVALFLYLLIVPLAALILVVPSALFAVRLSSRGDPGLRSASRVGLLVLCLLTWAGVGLIVGLAVDHTGDLTPTISVLARDVVWWSGPIVAAVVLWWQAERRRRPLMLGVTIGWLTAAVLAAGPAALHLQDPARSVPLATIDDAVLVDNGWTVERISERLPHQVNLRLDAERGRRAGPEYLTLQFYARTPFRFCSKSDSCELVGTTPAGHQIKTFTECDAGSYEPRPGLLVEVGEGAWRIAQMGGLACGDEHPNLTVEELVAFAHLLEPQSTEAFWAWADRVETSN